MIPTPLHMRVELLEQNAKRAFDALDDIQKIASNHSALPILAEIARIAEKGLGK